FHRVVPSPSTPYRLHVALHSSPTRRSSDLAHQPLARQPVALHHRWTGRCGSRDQYGQSGEAGARFSLHSREKLSQPLDVDLVAEDRKSTRLNSSHEWSAYAVFSLRKKRTEI